MVEAGGVEPPSLMGLLVTTTCLAGLDVSSDFLRPGGDETQPAPRKSRQQDTGNTTLLLRLLQRSTRISRHHPANARALKPRELILR